MTTSIERAELDRAYARAKDALDEATKLVVAQEKTLRILNERKTACAQAWNAARDAVLKVAEEQSLS